MRKLLLPLVILLFSLNYAFSLNSTVIDSASHYSRITTEKHYTTPAVNRNTLFYLQRDPNSNTVIYDLNTTANGALDTENPFHVYWIKYNERGQKEELNYIQKKFAYGLTVKQKEADNYDIRFVSYKKFQMSLMKDADGKYHIFALIANKQVVLKNLFVRVEGGSFWIPNILYVEVKGTDLVTGKEVTDRFKP